MGLGIKPTATLLAQIVNDAHAGLVPQIAGPNRVLVTNEDGDAVAWMLLTDFTQGDPGEDGRTVLNGTGAPSGGTGSDGDFYIDTAADDIYGPKTAGAWGSPTSLIGPAGPTGATGPAGADGVPSAPSSGDDGRIPFALSEDLAYTPNLYYDDVLHIIADTLAATTVGLHMGPENDAAEPTPIQRSPAIELEASSWDTDGTEATLQAYRMQVIPTSGSVPWSSLVIEHNTGSGYINAVRFTGSIFSLWDGSAWQDVANAIGGTVYFCPSAAPAAFVGDLEVLGDMAIVELRLARRENDGFDDALVLADATKPTGIRGTSYRLLNNGAWITQLSSTGLNLFNLIRLSTSDVVEIDGGGQGVSLGGALEVTGNFACNGEAPAARPTITGSRGGNAALASLLTALDAIGLITDGTSA